MTVNEKIQKIKVLLGLEAPAPAPVKPAALNMYKLTDGTEVAISALEVGGIVTVGDQPASAGEHTLEDGTAIVVDAAGVITEIVAATPAAPDVPVEDELAAKFSAIESTVTAQGQMLVALTDNVKKNSDVVAQLLSIVEKLAETPTADPAAAPAQSFTKAEPQTQAERFAGVQKAIKNLKK